MRWPDLSSLHIFAAFLGNDSFSINMTISQLSVPTGDAVNPYTDDILQTVQSTLQGIPGLSRLDHQITEDPVVVNTTVFEAGAA